MNKNSDAISVDINVNDNDNNSKIEEEYNRRVQKNTKLINFENFY